MLECVITDAVRKQLLPPRDENAHKTMFGRVAIIGGCVGYTGAPKLAAKAALRTGSGLIHVAVPGCVYPIIASSLDEPMVLPFADDGCGFAPSALPELLHLLERCDACAIGMGMGQNAHTQMLTLEILKNAKLPVVLDADGINVLSGHTDVLRNTACSVVLTPHDGEFARLGGELSLGRIEAVRALAEQTGQTVLLKGHRTLICDGQRLCTNFTGNPGMAKGGSGDALSGVIVSLLGQGLCAFDAAALGAWIHGRAGDLCARALGEYGMTPTDLIQAIPQVTMMGEE